MLFGLRPQKIVASIIVLATAMGSVPASFGAETTSEDERFKNVEIRVIRPRFFQKAQRFELGGAVSSIMNETFIYTYLMSGLATYHFSELIGLELSGSFGFNIDKEDKRILFEEFVIQTKIFRTAYAFEGALALTPLYGKWQLPSGRMIYFDTFVAAGAGMTGVQWRYSDFCPGTKDAVRPPDVTKPYPTLMGGLGQRYFITRDVAYRWDIRTHAVIYNKADAECDPSTSTVSGSSQHYTITLQLGASKYF